MKKGLLVLFLMVVLVGLIRVQFQAQKVKEDRIYTTPVAFYPECPVQPDVNKAGEYSLPDFDKPCYWVRYWNVSGYIAKTDERDGIAWDGQFIYNPEVSGEKIEKIYFQSLREKCYFLSHQVVSDPRLTNWWWAFIGDKHRTLWEAVERAALTRGYSNITKAIISHMVQSGVVSQEEIDKRKMTSERISAALYEYTRPAVTYIFHKTKEATGGGLTEEKFRNLQPGDQLLSYYWDRYGPYPAPTNYVLKVVRRKGAEIVVREESGEEMKILPQNVFCMFLSVRKSG